MKRDSRALMLGCSLALSSLAAEGQAMDLTTVDGEPTTMEAQMRGAETLALIVTSESELREAQRILTLPQEDAPGHTIALIAIPSQSALRKRMLELTASSFFQSEFSRQRIFLSSSKDLAPFQAKALLFVKGNPDPVSKYDRYPDP